jgi:hypothetical protein
MGRNNLTTPRLPGAHINVDKQVTNGEPQNQNRQRDGEACPC